MVKKLIGLSITLMLAELCIAVDQIDIDNIMERVKKRSEISAKRQEETKAEVDKILEKVKVAENPNLDLSNLKLPTTGWKRVMQALKEKDNVESINFRSSSIADGELEAIMRDLPQLPKLRSLDFSNNNITPDSELTLRVLLKRNENLNQVIIGGNKFLADNSASDKRLVSKDPSKPNL